MCGIAGIVSSDLSKEQLETRAIAMRERLRHRGPNDAGLFCDPGERCVLAHTRLAILDLSDAGHQPMTTPDGRYTIVFNGEIYNFAALRKELEATGVQFQSRSDTEVVLRLFERDGASSLDRLEGMFAFVIWDRDSESCFLARDPLGIKPLYIWRTSQALAFASEIRSVLSSDIGPRRIDASALTQYFMFGSVQEPRTLVQDVEMLPAGHALEWNAGFSKVSSYWDLAYSDEGYDRSADVEQSRAALDESVRRHFVSDVPVGIFLSGGIDSTALLALAKSNGYEQLKTFCISFNEQEFNEGHDATRTARHFGTDHHDWRMTAEDGSGLFEEFLESQDQPSTDGFNTFCVSKFARESGMKVVLSGLGGDELFGSYPTFAKVPQLMRWHRRLRFLRPLVAAALLRTRLGLISEWKANRLSAFLGSHGGAAPAYWTMRAFFTPSEAEKLAQHFTGEKTTGASAEAFEVEIPQCPTDRDTVGYLETTCYMRNQLLRDSDVFSMAHGLELRVPLVDRCLLQTINRIPSTLRHGAGKRLLLDAVPEIPAWIAKAPKRGFRFPFEQWVSVHWKDTFDRLERSSPIGLGSWYRKWILFTLKHFLNSNGLTTNQ